MPYIETYVIAIIFSISMIETEKLNNDQAILQNNTAVTKYPYTIITYFFRFSGMKFLDQVNSESFTQLVIGGSHLMLL